MHAAEVFGAGHEGRAWDRGAVCRPARLSPSFPGRVCSTPACTGQADASAPEAECRRQPNNHYIVGKEI